MHYQQVIKEHYIWEIQFVSLTFPKALKTKGSKPTCYNMFNVSGTTAPLLVNVKIGNEIVTMEADSGAAISVMSVNNFNNLKLYDYSTRKTDDTVRSVTGTEKVHSIVTVPVTVHGETYRLDLTLPLIPLIRSATSIRQLGHHVVSTVECHLLHPDCCCIRVEMVDQGLS